MLDLKKRIKFVPMVFDWMLTHQDLAEEFKVVRSPIGDVSVPDGEYVIRGEHKHHRKKYWVRDNTWYLVRELTVDKGQSISDSATYRLFPSLPEKDWIELGKHREKLSPTWRTHLSGYNVWQDRRSIARDGRFIYCRRKSN